jgi:Ca2+-binding RTX toxin-like protein
VASSRLVSHCGAGATISGAEHSDVIAAEAGDNLLVGGAGPDLLQGGAGADTLPGGAGSDLLRGGAGADVFHVALSDAGGANGAATDIILDFELGTDLLHLEGFAPPGEGASLSLTALSGGVLLKLNEDQVILLSGLDAIETLPESSLPFT